MTCLISFMSTLYFFVQNTFLPLMCIFENILFILNAIFIVLLFNLFLMLVIPVLSLLQLHLLITNQQPRISISSHKIENNTQKCEWNQHYSIKVQYRIFFYISYNLDQTNRYGQVDNQKDYWHYQIWRKKRLKMKLNWQSMHLITATSWGVTILCHHRISSWHFIWFCWKLLSSNSTWILLFIN